MGKHGGSVDGIWLEDFLAVVEEGGFSRAAARRNVTQPAFSRRIRALEAFVGASLFQRLPHGVSLTPAGEAFAELAPDLQRRIAHIARRAREAAGPTTSAVPFAATQTLSFVFFPDWIRRMGEGFELGPIQLNAANMATCAEMMRRQAAEFLICHHHPSVDDPFDGRLQHRVIGKDRMVAVHAPELEGREIAQLAYSTESGLGRIAAACVPSVFVADGKSPAFTSHLAAALRGAAVGGAGYAWLPLQLVAADLAERRLVRMAGDLPEIDINICIFRQGVLSAAAERVWKRVLLG